MYETAITTKSPPHLLRRKTPALHHCGMALARDLDTGTYNLSFHPSPGRGRFETQVPDHTRESS